ncbi:hypothetical protein [Paenirhodobacter hankyongi]|uniref:hypothetical protein n=1 Tax=Paenirhodobacter hankyongi TaxID=2294033 RepID=UPI001C7CFA8A|nr:hypothetical protein [Sinirhodobacter hankyongi]
MRHWSEHRPEQLIRTLHQGLLAEGVTVSIAKLCTWFGVPRRTVYYTPVKAAPKADPRVAEPIKAMLEAEPSFGYRTVAWLPGFNKNTVQRVQHLSRTDGVRCLTPAQGLAGPQACCGHAAPHRRRALRRHGAERALVNGSGAGLDRQGRLGFPGVRRGNGPPDRFLILLADRLPHARTLGLASVTFGQGHDRQRRARARPDQPVRNAWPGRSRILAEV